MDPFSRAECIDKDYMFGSILGFPHSWKRPFRQADSTGEHKPYNSSPISFPIDAALSG